MARQKVAASPATEFYLVNLLNHFIVADRLFPEDPNGVRRDEPLALLVKEAIDAEEAELKRAMFRQVGDVSLYLAGYFQDSLTRKWVDVGYYVDLGGAAYLQVAQRVDDDSRRPVYAELASKFSRFVDVLAEVGDKTLARPEKDLLRLYDLWKRTGSERIRRSLQEAGISATTLVSPGKRDIQ